MIYGLSNTRRYGWPACVFTLAIALCNQQVIAGSELMECVGGVGDASATAEARLCVERAADKLELEITGLQRNIGEALEGLYELNTLKLFKAAERDWAAHRNSSCELEAAWSKQGDAAREICKGLYAEQHIILLKGYLTCMGRRPGARCGQWSSVR